MKSNAAGFDYQFQPLNVARWTLALPTDLHWTTFCATRCQCFTNLSISRPPSRLWSSLVPCASSGRPEGCPTVVCSSLLRLLLKKVSYLFQSHQNAPVTFTDHNNRFPHPLVHFNPLVKSQVAQARNTSIGEHRHCCITFEI